MSGPPKKRWWLPTLTTHEKRELLVVIGLAITMQYLDYRGALSQWEGWFLDVALRWAPRSANQVLAVEIDDAAYKSFFGSSFPLDPKLLLKIVETLTTLNPKPAVIGIDILTEQPEYVDLAEKAKFNGVETVWAADARVSPKSENILGWFFGMHGETNFRRPMVLGSTEGSHLWGASLYFPDRDLGVRKATRSLRISDSLHINAWPRMVADVVSCNKAEPEEALVSYSGVPPREYKVGDLFACQPADGKCTPENLSPGLLWEEFEKEFRGKKPPIVLVGGTFGASPHLFTPIGYQPGLIADAYAVQAELPPPTYVRDFDPWLKFAFDIPLGLAIAWIVKRFANRSMRRGMQIAFLIAALIIVANVFLIHAGILWFSFAGVAFGTMLDQLVGLYRENPKTHPEKKAG
jgi:hypothetical protein